MIFLTTKNQPVCLVLTLGQKTGPAVITVGPVSDHTKQYRENSLLYYREFVTDVMPEKVYINLPVNANQIWLYVSGATIFDIKTTNIKYNPKITNIRLPDAERNTDQSKINNLEIRVVDGLQHTPARTIPQIGYIEIDSNAAVSYPQQWMYFIMLHELGHNFYKSEWKCDLWAFINFIKQGYNESQALYALTRVLHVSDRSLDRLSRVLNAANFTQSMGETPNYSLFNFSSYE